MAKEFQPDPYIDWDAWKATFMDLAAANLDRYPSQAETPDPDKEKDSWPTGTPDE